MGVRVYVCVVCVRACVRARVFVSQCIYMVYELTYNIQSAVPLSIYFLNEQHL